MNHFEKDGLEEVVYEGEMFEVIKQPMKLGEKKKSFEKVRRAPGVRLIIVNENKILLSKEYRHEN